MILIIDLEKCVNGRQCWSQLVTPEVMRTVKKSATTLARGFDSEQAHWEHDPHSFRGLFDRCCGGRKAQGITTRWWF